MPYVYFDKETKQILGISNEKDPEQNFVSKQKEDILDFLTGQKNISEYKFDRDFNIVSIVQQVPTVNEHIKKVNFNKHSDICITHGKNWKLVLKYNDTLNYKSNILFAVTEKNNPNILIRNFSVSPSVMSKVATVSFKYPTEENLNNISLWVFNCPYTCGITND